MAELQDEATITINETAGAQTDIMGMNLTTVIIIAVVAYILFK